MRWIILCLLPIVCLGQNQEQFFQTLGPEKAQSMRLLNERFLEFLDLNFPQQELSDQIDTLLIICETPWLRSEMDFSQEQNSDLLTIMEQTGMRKELYAITGFRQMDGNRYYFREEVESLDLDHLFPEEQNDLSNLVTDFNGHYDSILWGFKANPKGRKS